MENFKILKYPDQRLRKIAQPVQIINDKIKKIINKMFHTMYQNNGIGLAATQVNIHLRIIVIDIMKEKNNPIVLINPKTIQKFENISMEEGCLSLPGVNKIINRSKNIEVHALNENNQKIKIYATSLLAICIQHEMDHLSGKLLIDY
ncbi:Peptide deformylase [Buchnera aphidicola (Pterocallis alni)]|uniref:peptide deformylase n=1 Tax=Buchnera aphidicola TaxID=9 RepID=UPI0034648C8C